MCGKKKGEAQRGRALRVVSFPSTGGVDVSLHTLGPNQTGHRCHGHRYAIRPRKSETSTEIIDATAAEKSQDNAISRTLYFTTMTWNCTGILLGG